MASIPTGNPNGRPREHDRVEIAKKLIEWAKRESSMNLCGFSAEMGISPMVILNWTRIDPDFCLAYDEAKCYLGERRERALNSNALHQAAYNRNANVYDLYQRDELRDQLKFEAALKAQADIAVSEGDVKRYEAVMAQLNSLQSQRKAAAKSKSKDK